jgi:Mor family transcriptional regulator
MAKLSSREQRDKKIYLEYTGVNSEHVRVPAAVLAKRFNLSRGRIYQIIDKQTLTREVENARVKSRTKNTEADAAKVAEMLGELLGGG